MEGTYGKVKLAVHRLTGQEVAIKVVDKVHAPIVEREIETWRKLRHPHIAQLFEVLTSETRIFMVTEFARGGELFEYVSAKHREGKGTMVEVEARRIFRQLVEALKYCHDRKIVHRDLKLENVLLDEQWNVKLIDFGFTREYESKGKLLQTFCGSTAYAAPEMVIGQKYTGPEADIWSLGVILYSLVCGYLPFDDENEMVVFNKIKNVEYEFPDTVDVQAKELIRSVLKVDPKERASMEQILAHPWMHIEDGASQPLPAPSDLLVAAPVESTSTEAAATSLFEPPTIQVTRTVSSSSGIGQLSQREWTFPEKLLLHQLTLLGVDTYALRESVNEMTCDQAHGLFYLLLQKHKREDYRTLYAGWFHTSVVATQESGVSFELAPSNGNLLPQSIVQQVIGNSQHLQQVANAILHPQSSTDNNKTTTTKLSFPLVSKPRASSQPLVPLPIPHLSSTASPPRNTFPTAVESEHFSLSETPHSAPSSLANSPFSERFTAAKLRLHENSASAGASPSATPRKQQATISEEEEEEEEGANRPVQRKTESALTVPSTTSSAHLATPKSLPRSLGRNYRLSGGNHAFAKPAVTPFPAMDARKGMDKVPDATPQPPASLAEAWSLEDVTVEPQPSTAKEGVVPAESEVLSKVTPTTIAEVTPVTLRLSAAAAETNTTGTTTIMTTLNVSPVVPSLAGPPNNMLPSRGITAPLRRLYHSGAHLGLKLSQLYQQSRGSPTSASPLSVKLSSNTTESPTEAEPSPKRDQDAFVTGTPAISAVEVSPHNEAQQPQKSPTSPSFLDAMTDKLRSKWTHALTSPSESTSVSKDFSSIEAEKPLGNNPEPAESMARSPLRKAFKQKFFPTGANDANGTTTLTGLVPQPTTSVPAKISTPNAAEPDQTRSRE